MRYLKPLAVALLVLPFALPCQAQERNSPYNNSPPPPPQPPPVQAAQGPRNFWVYGPLGQYEFRKLANSEWVQNAPTGNYYFVETQRTPEYVELYDPSRGGYARLYANAMYTRAEVEPTWYFSLHGHWLH
jgi:hypothetical protein